MCEPRSPRLQAAPPGHRIRTRPRTAAPAAGSLAQPAARRPGWLLLASLLLATWGAAPPLEAQSPEHTLTSVVKRYRKLNRHRDIRGVRKAERTLRELGALEEAPEPVRAKARAFLRDVAVQKGPTSIFRVRVAAVDLLVELSEDPDTVRFLLGLARRSKAMELPELTFFIERALERLDTPQQVRHLVRHLGSSRDAVVRLCLGVLAGLQDDDLAALALPEAETVMDLARSGGPEMRIRAVELLGRLPHEKSLGVILSAAESQEPLLRLAAARALAHRPDPEKARKALRTLLVDPVARVREEAVEALAATGDEDLIPVLIGRLEKEPLRLRQTLAEALKSLAGVDLGPDPAVWKRWLRSRVAAGRPLSAGELRSNTRYAPRYYGIPVLSDRVVFILDVSGSMRFSTTDHPDAGGEPLRRLDVAKKELITVLGRLGPTTRFSIVTFSRSPLPFSRDGLLRATPENVQEAVEFVERQGASGGTNTYAAIKEAFESFPHADTFYLLSDGSPTVGRVIEQERIICHVARWNRLRGVRIHGIALLVGKAPSPGQEIRDDKQDARRFMRLLARYNDGTYAQRP